MRNILRENTENYGNNFPCGYLFVFISLAV